MVDDAMHVSLASMKSLERLKTIDTLPNLEGQLKEARELCTHGAKADMISKWLLEKLKTTPEFRASRDAWETLLSSFRLLSPQRVASLLSPQDFLEACKNAIAVKDPKTNKNDGAIVLVIHRLFEFLIGVCNGPDGMQLTAVLSVSASEAASFLGAWVSSTLTDVAHDWYEPGLEIWNRRRKSSDENEEFAKHSLLPISRLLPLLNHNEKTQKRKRETGDVEFPPWSDTSAIESLLARHVFAPGRTAFFKTRDSNGRQVGSQDPTFTLRSMLTALRDDGIDQDKLMVLPHLFDIVIRSTPVGNQNQRMKEKLWWDATFEGIAACATGPDDSYYVLRAVEDMLSVVQRTKAGLSKPVLDRLIERYSGLQSGKSVAWKMVSQVLQIDNDVFADDEMATVLANAITGASINAEQTSKTDRLPQRWRVPVQPEIPGQDFSEFLRKQVAAPLMKAFADRKKIVSFVNLWADQIRSSTSALIPSVWIELGEEFAPLLEDSLTPGQIIDIFDHYSATLRTGKEAAIASVAILDAILGGVKSEAVFLALHERCGTLLNLMLDFELSAALTNLKSVWSLMEKAFELWFPSWRNAQSDSTTVIDMAIRILESPEFKTAKFLEGTGPVHYSAQTFIACVCSHLYQYVSGNRSPTPRELCYDALKVIVDNQKFKDRLTILLRYPDLLTGLMEHDVLNLIQECIRDGAVEVAQKLMTVVFQNGNSRHTGDLTGLLQRYLSPEARTETGNDVSQEMAMLEALSRLSPAPTQRGHREKIVDAICRRQILDGAGLQASRFAVLINFMKHGNATSKLASDPQELWRLAKSVPLDMNGSTAQSLEELTHLITNQLLNTKDSERSQSMLLQFSKDVKVWMKGITVNERIDNTDNTIHVATRLIAEFENVKLGLPHKDAESMKLLADTCFRLAADSVNDDGQTFGLALKVLHAVPDEFIDRIKLEPLMESAISHVTAVQDASIDCLELAAKVSSPTGALDLFKHHLTPSQRERLLSLASVVPLSSILEDLRDENGRTGTLSFLATKLGKGQLADEDDIMGLLAMLSTRAVHTHSPMARKEAIQCVGDFLMNARIQQHSIEMTMVGVKKTLDDPTKAKAVYSELCQVLSAILQQHRAQIRGRHHLVVPIFKALLSLLFEPTDSKDKALTEKHAKAASKLLSLFAEPPQSMRSSDATSLVDEARQKQARVGRSVQSIVHHYCRKTLDGTMTPAVKDAITPGIWSLIEAMEWGEGNGVKSLSAAVDNSERAVLRDLYEYWKRFGKWRGE